MYVAYEQETSIKPLQPLTLPPNYILYVGTRTGYKNFAFFAEAISTVLKSNPKLYLVCAGGGPFSYEEKILLSGLKIAERVIYQKINSYNLPVVYKKAIAFFFPSLY
jgi:glycosyltransferase involved in cell wall biosynthesis